MSDLLVQEALKSARYNEAVIVTVTQSTSDKGPTNDEREIVLVPSLDSENGGIVWKDACTLNSYSDLDIGILRHIRTKKWVVPMLNDTHRNVLYNVSIRRGCRIAIEKILAGRDERINNIIDNRPSLRVLDIGSGTGLLAMMAAKHSLEIAKENQSRNNNDDLIGVEVKSVEMTSAMARLARKTISNNKLDHIIQVIEAHSCDEAFSPFPSSTKANLCTSELLESGLLGEGIIPAMRDAWKRHLNKDAVVIPQKARVYAQLIECHWITNYKGPLVANDFNLSPSHDPNDVLLGGNIVVPMHSESLLNNSNNDSVYFIGRAPMDSEKIETAKMLSDPILVLDFDFTSPESVPSESGRSVKKIIQTIDKGQAHGVLFWWEIDLYDEVYSTMGEHWQDHWQQCIFLLSETIELNKNEPFHLICSHDDYNISFEIHKDLELDNVNNSPKRQKIAASDSNYISFERALQLNDRERLLSLSQAIKTALDIKGLESCVLDVSDFSLCSLIAATQYGAKNVTSIESSCGDIPSLSARVTQLGNQLPKESCRFQIMNAHLESLSLDHFNGEQADIIMSEAYYEILQGWNLPCALNYYYITKSLKVKGLVKNTAISVPSVASVKCCAIEFHDCVTDAHCGLKGENGTICDFKHDDAIRYAQKFNTHDIILPLWQYKWKQLSDVITLAEINYEGDASSMCITGDGEWSRIKFIHDGSCSAIVHWIDYGLRVSDGQDNVNEDERTFKTISSGNRYHYQTIRMLSSPIIIRKVDIGSLGLAIKPSFLQNNMDDYVFEIKEENNNLT